MTGVTLSLEILAECCLDAYCHHVRWSVRLPISVASQLQMHAKHAILDRGGDRRLKDKREILASQGCYSLKPHHKYQHRLILCALLFWMHNVWLVPDYFLALEH